jgi:pimeloyl-ACP methyl ester carboxylesterase
LRNCLNGLKLYRANFLARARRPRERSTRTPVQFLVPRFDRYVTPALSEGLDRWLGRYRREVIGSTHWTVVRDAPLIAARIDSFAAWVANDASSCAMPPAVGPATNALPEGT